MHARHALSFSLFSKIPVSMKSVLIYLGIVAILSLFFNIFFYAARKEHIYTNVVSELSAVADLKTDEIIKWRKERLADGSLLGTSQEFVAILKNRKTMDTAKAVNTLLVPIIKSKRYNAAALLDTAGVAILRTNSGKWLGEHRELQANFNRVIRYGIPIMTDLHRYDDPFGKAHISVLSPVKEYGVAKTYGVLVLEIDPDDFFFPVVQSWPRKSETAEVLLVRRDGDSILVLNELRHKKGTTLSFKLPIDRKKMPASQAVHGFTGTMEGRDYRDIPVLATIRSIPSTPWYMIVKIDTEEAFLALHQLFLQSLASTILMILLLGSFGILFHLYRSTLMYTRLNQIESEKIALSSSLEESELRFKSVFNAMTEGVAINELVLDDQGRPSDVRILEFNAAFEKYAGISASRLRGAFASMLDLDNAASLFDEFFRVVTTGRPSEIETYFPSVDRFIALSISSIGNNRFATVFDDITSRKQAENEQEITIGLLNVLNTKNNLVDLIQEISLYLKTWLRCDAIGIRLKKNNDYPYFETRGFSSDFVASESSLCSTDENGAPILDESGNPFLGCLCGSIISSRFDPSKPFFTKDGSFWTNSTSQLVTDLKQDELPITLRNRCNSAGYESVALIRMKFAHEPIGLIQINYRAKNRFNLERIGILERFADNISIAIEQRKTQFDLYLEKEQYLVTLRSIGDGVITTDTQGKITLMNDVAEELTGCSAEEALGKPLYDVFKIVNETTRQQSENPVEKVLATGEIVELANHTVLIGKDGVERQIADSGAPIRNSDQKILGVVLVFRDVTERKNAEIELLQQREKAARYLDTVEAIVLALDLTGTITMINRKGCELLGYTQGDLIGKNWIAACVPESEMGNVLEVFTKMTNGDYSAFEYFENKVKTKNGELRDIEWHNTLIRDERGIIIAGLCAGEDITERRKAQKELAFEKERLLVTLRSIGDAVIATDVNGGITIMNRAAEHLTGWTREESEGKPLLEVFNIIDVSTHQPYADPIAGVLSTGNVFNLEGEAVLLRKNGTEIKIDSCCAPIRDAASAIIGITVVFRDITDKVRVEQAIQKNDKLEALGSLAAGIAHDFNNLLGGLFGYLDLARESALSGSDVTPYIDKAFAVFGRTKDLTAQLLTFATGGAPVRKTTFMTPFIRETVQFALSGTNIKPIFSIDEHLWYCDVDEHQLAQVVDNIAINARDAMPRGGRIIVSAENCPPGYAIPSMLAPGRYISIRIRDEGVGIAPEHLSLVFDPFFSTKQKGSGLGLSIAISIINKHGGTIEVTSKLGKGTVFSIFLPASDHTLVESADAVLREKHIGQGHVLVMDDENYICEVTTAMLSGMGYKPVACATGEDAIAEVERQLKTDQRYIFALLDLTIPGAMGGLDAGMALKKIDPDIRIIAMSGYSEDPVIAHPEKYGFEGSITKPYYRAILEETITKVLRHDVSAWG